MNTAQNIVTTPLNGAFTDKLQRVAQAVAKLEEANCRIVGLSASGRHATLIVAAPPAFVRGHCKSRLPKHNGGFTRVMATRYYDVQLEWFVDSPHAEEQAHA